MAIANGSPAGSKGKALPVITGMGHYFPPTVLSNSFFESLGIGTTAAWIEDRVGIRERRTILTEDDVRALRQGAITADGLRRAGRVLPMAEMCHQPWKTAQQHAEQSGAHHPIDVVIAGSSVPDWDIPANACSIASAVGLECTAFDLNSACSSFIVDLHAARGLLLSGLARQVAIFNAERYSLRMDFSDRSSCVLFGDGAAASVVGLGADLRGLAVVDTIVESSPAGHQHVRIPDGGTFSQNGAAVQKFAVSKTVAIARQIMERHHLSPADIAYFVGHQANFRMLTSACEKLGFSREQHLYNVDYCGNQGAAGAPAVLSIHWNRFKKGDFIVVAVVGAGLTWAAALLQVT